MSSMSRSRARHESYWTSWVVLATRWGPGARLLSPHATRLAIASPATPQRRKASRVVMRVSSPATPGRARTLPGEELAVSLSCRGFTRTILEEVIMSRRDSLRKPRAEAGSELGFAVVSAPDPLALQAITPSALADAIAVSLAEARKIVAMVHRGEPVRATSSVSRGAAAAAQAAGAVPALEVRSVHESAVDPFVKYVLGTGDGRVIETVRIPLARAGRYTVCVSSQVGCA